MYKFNFSPEEIEPDEDEKAILDAYENGDPEYQPAIPLEQLKKELGIA